MRWTRRRRRAPARRRGARRASSRAGARELARVLRRRTPADAAGRATSRRSSNASRLPREAFEAVIDGVAMDLERTRYETFDDLREYCLRVASAVGLHLHRDLRLPRPAAPAQYALDLGIALQLTNIIRDVRTDLARGRIYLPLEDLRALGCTEDDLRAGDGDRPRPRPARRSQCRRARELLRRGPSASCRPSIGGAWWRPRSWAASTSRSSSASSGAATTCSARRSACRVPRPLPRSRSAGGSTAGSRVWRLGR